MSLVTAPSMAVPAVPHANGFSARSLPDPYADGDDDRLFEVIRGKRVNKNMGLVLVRVAAILHSFLSTFCRENSLGHVDVEAPFSIPGSGNDRKPDVAFVSYQKWPKERPIPNINAWPIAPDLAVEVISPSDKAFDVIEKVHEYFAGGVQHVWQIYSNLGQVWLYTSPATIRILTRTDELVGDPIVPGFRMPVADLFPLVETQSQP
ncbi:MAG TPA: Uma2 family endonuclease [Urbifossiella sp.]